MGNQGKSDLKQVGWFFALSLFAWVIWGPQLARRLGWLSWAPSLSSPLNILTVWSPALAAIDAWYGQGGTKLPGLTETALLWLAAIFLATLPGLKPYPKRVTHPSKSPDLN